MATRPDFQDRYEMACRDAEERHAPLTAALVALGVRRTDCHVDQTGGMVFCHRLQLGSTEYPCVLSSIEQDDRGGSCTGYMADWGDEGSFPFIPGTPDGQTDWPVLARAIIDAAIEHGYQVDAR